MRTRSPVATTPGLDNVRSAGFRWHFGHSNSADVPMLLGDGNPGPFGRRPTPA